MVQLSAPVNKKGAVIGMICNRIKKERKRLKLTQPEFADIAGAKKRTIIEWEKGATSPNAVQLSALSAGGIDVQYILTGVPGYIPGPPSVLETARKQAYIDAVEKAAESNIADTVAVLTPLSTELNVRVGAKKDNKNKVYAVTEHRIEPENYAAESSGEYNSNNELSEQERALINNYRKITDAVERRMIERMAEVAGRESSAKLRSGKNKIEDNDK